MDFLHIALSAVFSFFTLLLLTRCMGHRHILEMSLFDYITGITIGSTAAELSITDFLDPQFLRILLAILLYALLTILLSYVTNKSLQVRRLVSGVPDALFQNGAFSYENLKKARIDASEFLSQCRINGYSDLSQVQAAFLEPNGKISFLPTAAGRPRPRATSPCTPRRKTSDAVVMDGIIVEKNLQRQARIVHGWKSNVRRRGSATLGIFLAFADKEKRCTFFPKN
ncbi:MAG: YetF domain-containing protein [Christensenellaceae bacterium]